MRIALVDLTYPFRARISHSSTLLCRALTERRQIELFALLHQYPALLG
jgi:hypothetical protein